MIRLVHVIRRRQGMSTAEFSAYWRDHHGPLVAYHQARLDMLRHVQTHRDPTGAAMEDSFRAARGGMEDPHDGVQETWWASEAALMRALTSDAGREAYEELLADEARFIDHAASPIWLAYEYPQVSTQRDRVVAKPKSGVAKLFFPLRQLPTMSPEEGQLYWRAHHGPLVRSFAVARGMLCYQQVHRYVSPWNGRLQSERGVKVDPYLGHAEAWTDTLNSRAGADLDAAATAARVDETNFIDWSRSTAWLGRELVLVDRDFAETE